jgi:TonB family protein
MRWFWQRRKREPEPVAAAPPPSGRNDLPRVVATTTIGHLSHGRGSVRLGFGGGGGTGGGWGIRAGDLTDLILPVILIGGALMYTQRSCKWHADDLSDYTPARALPSFSVGRSAGGAPPVSWGARDSSSQSVLGRSRTAADDRADAKNKGRTVDVVLDVQVNPDGTPGAVRVVRGAGGTVDQRAIDAAKKMQYQSATRRGVAEASHIEITLSVPLF